MRVLVACEYSGRVREAFRKRGHDAWSIDLLESEDASIYHMVGDAIDHIYGMLPEKSMIYSSAILLALIWLFPALVTSLQK